MGRQYHTALKEAHDETNSIGGPMNNGNDKTEQALESVLTSTGNIIHIIWRLAY